MLQLLSSDRCSVDYPETFEKNGIADHVADNNVDIFLGDANDGNISKIRGSGLFRLDIDGIPHYDPDNQLDEELLGLMRFIDNNGHCAKRRAKTSTPICYDLLNRKRATLGDDLRHLIVDGRGHSGHFDAKTKHRKHVYQTDDTGNEQKAMPRLNSRVFRKLAGVSCGDSEGYAEEIVMSN